MDYPYLAFWNERGKLALDTNWHKRVFLTHLHTTFLKLEEHIWVYLWCLESIQPLVGQGMTPSVHALRGVRNISAKSSLTIAGLTPASSKIPAAYASPVTARSKNSPASRRASYLSVCCVKGTVEVKNRPCDYSLCQPLPGFPHGRTTFWSPSYPP